MQQRQTETAPASRSPCGERGLKLERFRCLDPRPCRSPCGERGLKSKLTSSTPPPCSGRSPCGERGLKLHPASQGQRFSRRSPCGERGLKCFAIVIHLPSVASLPVRGAWVEISIGTNCNAKTKSRSPCGERGLKLRDCFGIRQNASRSPCGERGLKCARTPALAPCEPVAPRAGSVG